MKIHQRHLRALLLKQGQTGLAVEGRADVVTVTVTAEHSAQQIADRLGVSVAEVKRLAGSSLRDDGVAQFGGAVAAAPPPKKRRR